MNRPSFSSLWAPIFFCALGSTFNAVHSNAAPSPNQTSIRVVFLGDSLTEGYGVPKEKAYPNLIEKKFQDKKFQNRGNTSIEFINAGISGSTSASAEGRLKWLLPKKPKILLLALGANDGLRGLPLADLEQNLSRTIELAQRNKIKVILAGIQLPPSLGKKYTSSFARIYPHLAGKYHTELITFLLEGVAGHRELNQEDSIHPNEKGHEKIAEIVTPYLEKMISHLDES